MLMSLQEEYMHFQELEDLLVTESLSTHSDSELGNLYAKEQDALEIVSPLTDARNKVDF